MARAPRLGLQRRIMLLVTVGLALMFTVGAVLGLSAIEEATQQVFEERLATAHATVAVFQRDVDRLASEISLLAEADSTTGSSAIAQRVLDALGDDDRYPFFRVVGVSAVDRDGLVLDSVGQGLATSITAPIDYGASDRFLVPAAATPGATEVPFFDVVVPVHGSAPADPIAFVGHTVSRNSDIAFVPTRLAASNTEGPHEDDAEPYNLEILGPDGGTLLALGGSGRAGTDSHHLLKLEDALATREAAALVDDRGTSDHVMAAVPIPDSSLFLVLEQPVDVALALPNRLREQLLLLIGAGFAVTLVVAWFTTRQVVKPTAELTAAASRMADGDLSEPIDVAAYDEVETLATTLELMRRRLLDAQTQLVDVNRDLETRIAERTARLGIVLRQTISAQEEERHALARELHDETAQTVAALSIALDRARQDVGRSDAAGLDRIGEAKAIATRLLDEIRRLIMGLRPSVLDDLGLGPAISWYAETVTSERGQPTVVSVDVPGERLPRHLEVALFRIAQEALNNVAKHAEAAAASVTIRREGDIILVVEDDGVGFDVEATDVARTAGGIGLAGMQERAVLLGGSMTISSTVGQGTRLTIRVPSADDEAER